MADKDTEKVSNEKTYLVKYRLPGEEGRNPRKRKVVARSQADAKKTLLADIPNAKVVGGAKVLDEGVVDFARKVGDFLKRCVGRGCLAYAKSAIRRTGPISTTRKIFTRELAQMAGERLVKSGGGETKKTPKVKFAKKYKKRTTKKYKAPTFGLKRR